MYCKVVETLSGCDIVSESLIEISRLIDENMYQISNIRAYVNLKFLIVLTTEENYNYFTDTDRYYPSGRKAICVNQWQKSRRFSALVFAETGEMLGSINEWGLGSVQADASAEEPANADVVKNRLVLDIF